MEAEQKSTLRKCRVRMVNDLNIEQMMDVFDSRELFTPIMMEYIKSEKNRPEKIRTMLDYLQRRGPKAFELFLVCLRESDHGFVASYLLQEYMKLKGVTIESCGEGATQMATGNQSEQIQTIYLAQETQGGGDDEMSDVDLTEEATEMELESGLSMIQESIHPADAACSQESSGQPSDASLSSTTQGLPEAGLLAPSGYTRNFEEEYVMDSSPRGYLLIINNGTFNGVMTDRHGTDVDCKLLQDVFMKLGFGVDVRTNLTAAEIQYNLTYLSRLDSLRTVDSLLVAILTHGSEEVVFGVDGVPVTMSDVFEPFTSERCPALHHKPKFFIINACRGDLEDKGAVTVSLRDKTTSMSKDADPEKQHQVIKDIIPNQKDFIVAYSTVPKHVSWRHQNDGSWFIQALTKIFDEYSATKDVVSMLIKVNNEVAKNGIQIPAPQIMLTKTWYLNPV